MNARPDHAWRGLRKHCLGAHPRSRRLIPNRASIIAVLLSNQAEVVQLFGCFKSERRERRKKVRQDRKQLEVRARRFLKSYLEADEARKPEFYRAVEDTSRKCRPPI